MAMERDTSSMRYLLDYTKSWEQPQNMSSFPQQQFKCKQCSKMFMQKRKLKSHQVHCGKKTWKCAYCRKCFSCKSLLATHTRRHTGEKPFQCGQCDKTFAQNSHLTAHSRTHSGEKPFKCSVCIKTFSVKGNLARHYMLHTREKPFKCGQCDKSFSQKIQLMTHKDTHTGEQLYKCMKCYKAYIRKQYLPEEHTRTRTGKKPFSRKSDSTIHQKENFCNVPFCCWFCTDTFTSPEDVVVHMTKAHDNLDNLSRSIEAKNQLPATNESCHLKLKVNETSLSPVDSLKWPKWEKKRKGEEYQLHIASHHSTHNSDLLLRTETGFSGNHCTDTNTANPPSSTLEEVLLTDQVSTGDHMVGNSESESLDLSKPSVVLLCRLTTPLTCWFCSAQFTSCEEVVEHMTTAHEDLDLLSKRVEEQCIPSFHTNTNSNRGGKIS